jgi:hypothetical protein
MFDETDALFEKRGEVRDRGAPSTSRVSGVTSSARIYSAACSRARTIARICRRDETRSASQTESRIPPRPIPHKKGQTTTSPNSMSPLTLLSALAPTAQ